MYLHENWAIAFIILVPLGVWKLGEIVVLVTLAIKRSRNLDD